jgi:ABC-type amino acid transport system permease subunit
MRILFFRDRPLPRDGGRVQGGLEQHLLGRLSTRPDGLEVAMGRSFGSGELLYLLKAIPWTLALSLGALIGGGVVGLVIAILRTAPMSPPRWFTFVKRAINQY